MGLLKVTKAAAGGRAGLQTRALESPSGARSATPASLAPGNPPTGR